MRKFAFLRKIVFASSFVILASFTPFLLAEDALPTTEQGNEYPTYPKLSTGSGEKSEQIKRGEYLAKMGDCIACHTAPHGGQAFAGGYPVNTPFGTLYSPNITGDKETGIGSWSDENFIRAMREGINPKGHYDYPAFPYLYFNLVTDDDLKAIKAYLDAIPPVHQPNKANSMHWPFSWRFLQIGWRMLFFQFQKTGVYQPDPSQSATWNRGKYIVQGLGHCSMCHTPSYYLFSEKFSLAAPIRKYDLTGAMVEGFYAPNITSSALKNVDEKEIAAVFLKDKLIGGGNVAGPMLDVNHDSLQHISNEDLLAIATYLKTVKSQTPPQPKKSNQSGLEQGSDTYNKYCTGCHSTGAGGAPKVGDMTAWDPLLKQGLNTLYKNAIAGINGMPPKGTCVTCTNQDIEYAVNYMVNETKGSSSTTESTPAVQPVKPLSLEDGKKLFEKYCSVCHAPNTNYLNAPKLGDDKAWAPRIKQGLELLLLHTINGYGNMAPRGACQSCNDAEIKAAVKYLVQNSQKGKDYNLW